MSNIKNCKNKTLGFKYLAQNLWIYQQDMYGGGFGGGGFNNGWGNNNGWGQSGFQQPGGFGVTINLGGGGMGGMGGGFGFNRWGNSCANYQTMNGYQYVDYSNGWNPNYHDQLLRSSIDNVYQRYDHNFSGQLEGNEFYYAYRDLCLMMGIAPPMDYQSVWNAVMQCDSNFNGRISKMEMFMMFKRIQGINMGYGF